MTKKVLITGGAKGLGAAIAEEFAKNGYDIIITYKDSEKEAEDLSKKLARLYDIKMDSYKLDLRSEKDIIDLFAKIDSISCLVNNAATNDDADVLNHTKEKFLEILETNLIGSYLMCKYAYSSLKENNGSIINIASTNGIDTMYPESLDYDASKAGIINLTQNLSSAFAPNVRVNAIAPGWINTKSTVDMNPNLKKSELSKIALGRFAEPEEIASCVYFVASDKASYMTGTVIRIDGGKKYGC